MSNEYNKPDEKTKLNTPKETRPDFGLSIKFDYLAPLYNNVNLKNINNFLDKQDNIIKEKNIIKFNFEYLFKKKIRKNNDFVENYLNNNNNNEFFSDSESIYLNFNNQNKILNLNFYQDNLKTGDFNLNKINLDNLIELNNKIYQNQLIYNCKYCKEKFSKASALGGHTSKKHSDRTKPNGGKGGSNRKIEAERSRYIKSIMNN